MVEEGQQMRAGQRGTQDTWQGGSGGLEAKHVPAHVFLA